MSSNNDRACKNCRFWDRMPKPHQESGECERIKGQYSFYSGLKGERIESTARVHSRDECAGLICKDTFGCNLFEEGSISDNKRGR